MIAYKNGGIYGIYYQRDVTTGISAPAEFLYESIFQREGEELLPRTIISQPDLQVYIQDFGTLKMMPVCAQRLTNR